MPENNDRRPNKYGAWYPGCEYEAEARSPTASVFHGAVCLVLGLVLLGCELGVCTDMSGGASMSYKLFELFLLAYGVFMIFRGLWIRQRDGWWW